MVADNLNIFFGIAQQKARGIHSFFCGSGDGFYVALFCHLCLLIVITNCMTILQLNTLNTQFEKCICKYICVCNTIIVVKCVYREFHFNSLSHCPPHPLCYTLPTYYSIHSVQKKIMKRFFWLFFLKWRQRGSVQREGDYSVNRDDDDVMTMTTKCV